eukprot:scaffold24806_cov72-Skeletonema_dohrnii-CCMP3373.AAC.2
MVVFHNKEKKRFSADTHHIEREELVLKNSSGLRKKMPRVFVAFAAGEFSWRSGVTWKKIGLVREE